MRLIHEGRLIPDQMDLHSEEELRDVLEKCGVPAAEDSAKVHGNTHFLSSLDGDIFINFCCLYTELIINPIT